MLPDKSGKKLFFINYKRQNIIKFLDTLVLY